MTKTDPLEHGSFTLPGEAGYEDLTLRLAEKWGADTIRDSDGTVLSPALVEAGYDIYSTVCLVRAVDDWAKANPDKLQQNFLMSFPVVAEAATVTIDLLAGFFKEQFVLNTRDDPKRWWQVFDRTTGDEIPAQQWTFQADTGKVILRDAVPWHAYTVNFLAYRIWEEISMYNHITNDWGDREHLAAVDPMYPETQETLLQYLRQWLEEHPDTSVVRFTSMFYNFSWFWGDDPERLRFVYSDWADYAMTVSPLALTHFAEANGYELTSEDFVNGGLYNSTHNAPSPRYRDYMAFIHRFVADFGRQCVDLVHAYGKKAFVFYDDHWVGVEPYGPQFGNIGFDGLIKCVFNAFEVRKCAGVRDVATHELRLHPYLFPTGLKGEPTFEVGGGGDPARDAKAFWMDARRGILRAPIERIGLGGYLSLTEPWPEFVETIEHLADEFRLLKSFHDEDAPYTAPYKVAVLTSWGALRSWIASGHFHEGLEYNEMIESLAGLPVDVRFISLRDVKEHGVPKDVNVILNCGREGSAWSGGHEWRDPKVVERLTAWVAAGGGFIGISEPGAVPGQGEYFRMGRVLGVDRDRGECLALDRRKYTLEEEHFIAADLEDDPDFGDEVAGIFTTGPGTRVLADRSGRGPAFAGGSVALSTNQFGDGRAVYLSGFKCSHVNTRLLHRALAWAAGCEADWSCWSSSNPGTECAWFPGGGKLVVINNTATPQETTVTLGDGTSTREVSLDAYGIEILDQGTASPEGI